MRIGVCVLPTQGRREAAATWRNIESLGYAHAWTYDHITWAGLTQGPWYSATVTLTAAAMVTERLRLGTLVSSANFRHPVPFAQELVTLDEISGGRLTLGFGAGATGPDASVLGLPAWSAKERAARYEEFVDLLDRLLRGGADGRPRTSFEGEYYTARDARAEPGCVQRPRLPFALAAAGPRGMRLAARQAATWVITDGETAKPADGTRGIERLRELCRRLDDACEQEDRDPATIDRLLLSGFGSLRVTDPVTAFEDAAGALAEVGFTDLVVHQPRPSEPFAYQADLLERIAEMLPRLARDDVRRDVPGPRPAATEEV